MNWSAFAGAFLGVLLPLIILIAAIVVWDYFDRRKSHKPAQSKNTKPLLDDILESHLEEFIVRNFNDLFPKWRIYDEVTEDSQSNSNKRPKGVRYRTDAGEIDLLCKDENGEFVIIELKRNRAPDKVVAQIDRYIAWVEKNLIQSGQSVRGIIIAKDFSNHLNYTLTRRDDIDLWVYQWQLEFSGSTQGIQL